MVLDEIIRHFIGVIMFVPAPLRDILDATDCSGDIESKTSAQKCRTHQLSLTVTTLTVADIQARFDYTVCPQANGSTPCSHQGTVISTAY